MKSYLQMNSYKCGNNAELLGYVWQNMYLWVSSSQEKCTQ
jgi:hypothetical protein